MSGRKNICFFSMACRHCQAFLGELSKTPYAAEFQLICVDPGKRPAELTTLPSWLKVVPTLVIVGEKEPRAGPGPVTNWLFERRMSEAVSDSGIKTSVGGTRAIEERSAPLAMPTYSADIPKPTIASRTDSVTPAKSTGEPTPYHINEMGSNKISDSYGFLTDAFSMEKGTGTNRIVRNFAQLMDVASGSSESAKPARSKKEEEQISAMEQYMKARNAGIPEPIKRM
jgi:hypothetical protein